MQFEFDSGSTQLKGYSRIFYMSLIFDLHSPSPINGDLFQLTACSMELGLGLGDKMIVIYIVDRQVKKKRSMERSIVKLTAAWKPRALLLLGS